MNCSSLYGFTWTAYATAAAIGSVLLDKAFDATGSYGPLLVRLSILTFVAGLMMLGMPNCPRDALDEPSASAFDGLPKTVLENGKIVSGSKRLVMVRL
jgi:hypothetical protein